MLIRFCLAVGLATSGAAFAQGGPLTMPVPPALDLWNEQWDQLEYEWARDFSTYLRLIQMNEKIRAFQHHEVLLSVLGRINALAIKQLRTYPEIDVRRAVGRVLIDDSKLVRAHMNFYDPGHVATMDAYLNLLRRDAQNNWTLWRASRAALGPRKRRYFAVRGVWFGGGFMTAMSSYWYTIKAMHVFPATTTSEVAILLSAGFGVAVAKVTAGKNAPRGPRLWDKNVVDYGLEHCQRALTTL